MAMEKYRTEKGVFGTKGLERITKGTPSREQAALSSSFLWMKKLR